jgi:hypothetical protein
LRFPFFEGASRAGAAFGAASDLTGAASFLPAIGLFCIWFSPRFLVSDYANSLATCRGINFHGETIPVFPAPHLPQ